MSTLVKLKHTEETSKCDHHKRDVDIYGQCCCYHRSDDGRLRYFYYYIIPYFFYLFFFVFVLGDVQTELNFELTCTRKVEISSIMFVLVGNVIGSGEKQCMLKRGINMNLIVGVVIEKLKVQTLVELFVREKCERVMMMIIDFMLQEKNMKRLDFWKCLYLLYILLHKNFLFGFFQQCSILLTLWREIGFR